MVSTIAELIYDVNSPPPSPFVTDILTVHVYLHGNFKSLILDQGFKVSRLLLWRCLINNLSENLYRHNAGWLVCHQYDWSQGPQKHKLKRMFCIVNTTCFLEIAEVSDTGPLSFSCLSIILL